MGLSINDSVYSSVFFFLTGLHFFHLVVGLFLLSLLFSTASHSYHASRYFPSFKDANLVLGPAIATLNSTLPRAHKEVASGSFCLIVHSP